MAYRKLGRDSSARKALLRSIVTSLFQHERIETTEAKAKELRKVAEKMLTLAKRLHAYYQNWRSSGRCRSDGNHRISVIAYETAVAQCRSGFFTRR